MSYNCKKRLKCSSYRYCSSPLKFIESDLDSDSDTSSNDLLEHSGGDSSCSISVSSHNLPSTLASDLESNSMSSQGTDNSSEPPESDYSFDFGDISKTIVLFVAMYYVSLISGFSENGFTALLKVLNVSLFWLCIFNNTFVYLIIGVS